MLKTPFKSLATIGCLPTGKLSIGKSVEDNIDRAQLMVLYSFPSIYKHDRKFITSVI